MNLNVPDTRQLELARRLQEGQQVIAVEAAQEFDVSVDTIRRDILALEAEGKAQRVRGGAVPLSTPATPLHKRLSRDVAPDTKLVSAAIREIGSAATLLIDGGTTTLAIVEHLPQEEVRLVITPSPWIAIACQQKNVPVYVLGGSLRPQGGIATGDTAIERVGDVAADVAILGACGLEAEFGLSSDDAEEAMMKKAMHRAASRTIVVTSHAKIGLRACHRTVALSEIDAVVTDSHNATTDLIASHTRVVTK
ncbi:MULTISPECIES: DeoR/GlpR family DNA-binding transcription regulator [unclassified Ruegeria]|uniref:DeoR/GlpR family DNA-binding transcription regulator n=1 Tax=unclassified Ruegeria TaxID=2625375 RepID=UPI001489B9FB|nr:MULTISPECIES: DeoR/GlpR family DNA-binding transcription regulator [unclassified Ruegeria]NOD62828.1 DeoR family transcriptional regulator [Ruegeria sp. HKCCD6109]